jgi:hypothetical protein
MIGLFTTSQCSKANFVPIRNSTFMLRSGELRIQNITMKSYETLTRLIKDVDCPSQSTVKILRPKIPRNIIIMYHCFKKCASLGGFCNLKTDAFLPVSGFFIVCGIIWVITFYKPIKKLSHTHLSEWRIN